MKNDQIRWKNQVESKKRIAKISLNTNLREKNENLMEQKGINMYINCHSITNMKWKDYHLNKRGIELSKN